MKYTKEQLQGMGNYEIAKALCGLLGYETTFVHPYHETEMPTLNVYEKSTGRFFAFEAGRWDDIMPLAFECGISLIKDLDAENYYACANFDDKHTQFADYDFEVYNENPLRAIACCLILVLQENQNEQTNN